MPVRILDYLDTHTLYEIHLARRSGIKGGHDYWGDPQVHISNYTTSRLPRDVSARLPPLGRDRRFDNITWYYSPDISMELVLTVFRLAGYEIIEERLSAPDVINGRRSPVYIVGRRRR